MYYDIRTRGLVLLVVQTCGEAGFSAFATSGV
jgi:hypothetical protein